MLNSAGEPKWVVPGNGAGGGEQPYRGSGCNHVICCSHRASLLLVFAASLSDNPKLPSGHCCKPNSPQGGAILVVFGGDLFVNLICAEDGSKQITISFVIYSKLGFC